MVLLSVWEPISSVIFSLKDKDSSYKIYNINGTIYFNQEINKCYDKQNEIETDLKKIFNDVDDLIID